MYFICSSVCRYIITFFSLSQNPEDVAIAKEYGVTHCGGEELITEVWSLTRPEGIKLFSRSTQLSMNFILLMNIKIVRIKRCFML